MKGFILSQKILRYNPFSTTECRNDETQTTEQQTLFFSTSFKCRPFVKREDRRVRVSWGHRLVMWSEQSVVGAWGGGEKGKQDQTNKTNGN